MATGTGMQMGLLAIGAVCVGFVLGRYSGDTPTTTGAAPSVSAPVPKKEPTATLYLDASGHRLKVATVYGTNGNAPLVVCKLLSFDLVEVSRPSATLPSVNAATVLGRQYRDDAVTQWICEDDP